MMKVFTRPTSASDFLINFSISFSIIVFKRVRGKQQKTYSFKKKDLFLQSRTRKFDRKSGRFLEDYFTWILRWPARGSWFLNKTLKNLKVKLNFGFLGSRVHLNQNIWYLRLQKLFWRKRSERRSTLNCKQTKWKYFVSIQNFLTFSGCGDAYHPNHVEQSRRKLSKTVACVQRKYAEGEGRKIMDFCTTHEQKFKISQSPSNSKDGSRRPSTIRLWQRRELLRRWIGVWDNFDL
jgi:hypothetical protein